MAPALHALRHLPLVCTPCGNTLPRVELALEKDAHSGSTRAIVAATTHFNDAKIIAEVSRGLGGAMSGTSNIKESQVAFRERGH